MSKTSTDLIRHALSGPTMGTRWSALFFTPPGFDARPVQTALQKAVDEVDAHMSTWKPDSDFLYRDELTSWQAEGKLAHLSLAVSRGDGPHQYVQDVLRQEATQVAEAIRQGAKVMVCGGREMARGVCDALTEILKPAGLTPAMLKAGGRYVEDVY